MTPVPGSILSTIDSPDDLKSLNKEQLKQLAEELRVFILDIVSVHPGHLGSSLGVVELTIALHYVFNTPYDKLIWDVGHQAYAHKILTGRRDNFHTNRTLGGISGFPSMKESEYDAFGTGHSSTSVSAALGMAIASKQKGETNRQHIAVIGDGALSAGMALEGLNNVGVTNSNILVVLNDNGISIDKSVGAIGDYLAKMSSLSNYGKLRGSIWKGNAKAGNFKYFGPVDGHDLKKLTRVLEEIKGIEGPKLLHVITKKGKGFEKAEREQTTFHAPGKFNRKTGELQSAQQQTTIPTYQDVFGETMLELARADDKIIAITPAMPTGSALTGMQHEFPKRVFDVGIAEQHAVTF
jgi:1-deoxy-D-xylulose-5-phosphate synthase